jgi:tRNA threonylcarbamoyladenosine biosynthesis protein TsaB
MLILTIRTDKPEAEIALFEDENRLAYETWQAHRELASTIHKKIELLVHGQKKQLKDVKGIVCFKGPGSFTGLRIGITVADSLAYGLEIPIVATGGDDWMEIGLRRLQAGEDDRIALPHYGSEAHITKPRK